MLFNIDKISDKFDSMTDFIPLFKFDSQNMNTEHTMYVNKNKIYAFSHFKKEEKECLLVKFDNKRNFMPEYVICKEDNPVAFNEIFKGLPEKLPKHNDTTS
jgi:hypothetical protein